MMDSPIHGLCVVLSITAMLGCFECFQTVRPEPCTGVHLAEGSSEASPPPLPGSATAAPSPHPVWPGDTTSHAAPTTLMFVYLCFGCGFSAQMRLFVLDVSRARRQSGSWREERGGDREGRVLLSLAVGFTCTEGGLCGWGVCVGGWGVQVRHTQGATVVIVLDSGLSLISSLTHSLTSPEKDGLNLSQWG